MGMLQTIRRLMTRARRFGRANGGVAAVEFALVMPIMLTLYLGGLELSQLISADRRVQVVTGTMGDLTARANRSLCLTQLNDYAAAASAIMSPYSADGLKQTITQLSVAADGKAVVMWSRGYGGATALVKDATYDLDKTSAISALARGQTLIMASSSYSYLPLLGLFFKTPFNLTSHNYYLPRFVTPIEIETDC